KMINIQCSLLYDWITRIFINNGLKKTHAKIIADTLVEADLRGVDTHGSILTETYINRIQAETINKNPNLNIEKKGSAIATLNGENGFGQLSAYIAMNHSIQQAKKFGIALTTVRKSNHFGAAAFYTTMAAKQN